ncbi:MAG: gamma-glutamyltransferase [Gemmatimonadetes bacterium]|nr:gamma-glutamyltransferase [Gemmatimonadota bacterium]
MRLAARRALALVTLPAALAAQQRPSTMAGRSTVYAPHGVVATSQPLASAAGLRVLQQGGNAIDAAVAAAAVLSVVEPHMTGIGGDLFALIWLAKEQKLVALNASGRAGSGMTRAELVKRGRTRMPQSGIETVTVPGALAGWATLLKTHGTLPLAKALEPAIGYADRGFPVSPIIAAQWATHVELLSKDDGAKATFLVDGRAPRAGEWFRNPDYAKTLRTIATGGIGTLYGGALGATLVKRIAELGGFVTLEDLKKNQPTWVTPISVPYKGYRLWELPPNNQGVAALEMLRILEPYDLKAMGHNSAAYLHHLIEAKKLAYADLERFVGDADHLAMPVDRMLGDAFIAERRSHLDAQRAMERTDPGPLRTQSETVYLTAADEEGNMVSFINSNYDEFGSGVVVPGTGFILHDRGAAFSMTEGLPNTVAPGKRPFHTLIPAFVTRLGEAGKPEVPWMSFGVMGGAMQAQGHVQLLLNMLVFGMDVQEAVDAPRFRHMAGKRVALETPIGDAVRAQLTAMGHEIIDERPIQFGGAQAIVKLARGYAAGSDPRKDGHAAAY